MPFNLDKRFGPALGGLAAGKQARLEQQTMEAELRIKDIATQQAKVDLNRSKAQLPADIATSKVKEQKATKTLERGLVSKQLDVAEAEMDAKISQFSQAAENQQLLDLYQASQVSTDQETWDLELDRLQQKYGDDLDIGDFGFNADYEHDKPRLQKWGKAAINTLDHRQALELQQLKNIAAIAEKQGLLGKDKFLMSAFNRMLNGEQLDPKLQEAVNKHVYGASGLTTQQLIQLISSTPAGMRLWYGADTAEEGISNLVKYISASEEVAKRLMRPDRVTEKESTVEKTTVVGPILNGLNAADYPGKMGTDNNGQRYRSEQIKGSWNWVQVN